MVGPMQAVARAERSLVPPYLVRKIRVALQK